MAWEWPTYVDPEGPPRLDDPEQQAAVDRAMRRDLGMRATGIPVGVVAAALPDPAATGVLGYVPAQGLAAGFVNTAHGLSDFHEGLMKTTPITKYLPIPVLPHAQTQPDDTWVQSQVNKVYPYLQPAFDWATGVQERTERRAEEIVPHMMPENEGEQAALKSGEQVGGLGASIPAGGAMGAVGKLLPSVITRTAGVIGHVMPGFASPTTTALNAGLAGLGETGTRLTPGFDSSAPIGQQSVTGLDPSTLPVPPIPPDKPPPLHIDPQMLPQPTQFTGPPPPSFGGQGNTGWSLSGLFPDVPTGVRNAAIVLGSVGGVLIAHRGGAGLSQYIREERYARDAANFNADYAARRAPDAVDMPNTPIPEAPTPPRPGVAPETATGLNRYWLDSNARAKAFVDSVEANPDIARELKYDIGNVHDDVAFQNMMGEFARTGVYDTGMVVRRLPPTEVWAREVATLPDVGPRSQDRLATTIAYENALNDRTNLQAKMVREGTVDPMKGPEQFHYDYANISTDAMQRYVAQTRTDPVMASLLDRRNERGRGVLSIADDEGFITPAERADLIAKHPEYMATANESGKIAQTFGPRELTSGGGTLNIPTRPWELDKQHEMSLMRAIQLNTLKRSLVDMDERAAARDPNYARMFTEERNPVTGESSPGGQSDPVIMVRRGTGHTYHRVNAEDMYRWMTGSDAQLKVGINWASNTKKFLTENTTGMWSLLSGRFFPLINLPRQMLQLAVNRPVGMYGGLADKFMQRAGLPFGNTAIPDPTTPIGVAYSIGANMASRMSLGIAHTFDRGANNFLNNKMRSSIGDAAVDAISARAMRRYQDSLLSEERARGLSGQGGGALAELPRNQPGSNASTFAQLNNMVPQLYRTYGMTGNWGVPMYLRASALLRDMYTIVNDGVQSYAYRLNRNNTRMSSGALAYEIRDLSGNPAIKGSGRVAQAISETVPYANVSAQGLRRQVQAWTSNPVGSIGGMMGMLSTAALGELLSAWVQGPDAMKKLTDETTLQQRAANVTFYHHEGQTSFSLPQEFRAPYALALETWSALLGAMDAHRGEDAFKFMGNVLHDFFDHYITNSSVDAMIHGAVDALPFTQLPPWANAVGHLAGVDINPSGPLLGQPAVFQHSDRTMPNYVPDSLLDSNNGKIGRQLIGDFGGALQGVWDIAAAVMKQPQFAPSNWYGIGTAVEEWRQKAKDAQPMLGAVWQNQVQQSRQEPMAESVMKRLANMKETIGAGADISGEGMTRPRQGLPIAGGEQSKVPTDPMMRELYILTSKNVAALDARFLPPINDLKKQMDVIDRAAYAPEVKRDMHNKIADELRAKYEDLYGRLLDINYAASQLVGAHVDVGGKIDWHGTTDQFIKDPDLRQTPAVAPGPAQFVPTMPMPSGPPIARPTQMFGPRTR